MADSTKKRLIVGISGASGAILGIEILKAMQLFADWETHLVISESGSRTIVHETPYSPREVAALADRSHAPADIGASIASGTFKTEGMVVAPCSMNTLGAVAGGLSTNLLLRAADVVLKERRKLVLLARETPLSPVHVRNLELVLSYGAIVMPPVMTFYHRPQTIDDMVRHMVGKVLDLFDLELPGLKRWDGEGGSPGESVS
ncbi:UbiX family flavin prenyltransferase [Consotaella aegiceratis]|uniref:UbiX family flavin prenyltransferase n=1 Tax=Consotaella aegiceratis TaxID=3097961 RepID=UPI002F41545C